MPEPTNDHPPALTPAKRRYNAIIDALNDTKDGRKARGVLDPLNQLLHDGRWIFRALGPFVSLRDLVTIGMTLKDGRDDGDSGLTPEELEETQKLFSAALFILTGFQSDLQYHVNDTRSLLRVVELISQTARRGRHEDTHTIKNNVLDYAPIPPNVPVQSGKVPKDKRGWESVRCARMLCPIDRLEEFDADPTAFCNRVKHEPKNITADGLPAFLWDETMLDLENLESGFMRGPVLLSCARAVFTSPDSALKETPGAIGGGKGCLCKIYKDKMQSGRFSVEMIAYIAVFTRFGLSAENGWTGEDRFFNYDAFYRNLVDVFLQKDDAWCIETLAWWQLWVLNRPDMSPLGPLTTMHSAPPQAGSARERLILQRAARCAAHAEGIPAD